MIRKSVALKIPLLGLLLFLSQTIHWSDSELWAIGLAKNIFSSVNLSTDYKILFNGLLHLVYGFSSSNLEVIQNSRFLFAVVGILVLFLVQGIGRLVNEKEGSGSLAFFLLAFTTLFISQGFKVRSDLLGGAMQLLGLYYFLRLQKTKDPTDRLRISEATLGIILNILVMLATPKGVYNVAINLVFIGAVYWQQRHPWMRQYLTALFLVPMAVILVFALSRYASFVSAWEFFIKSYKESPQHPAFWTIESFRFVLGSFLRNIHIVLLCGIGILGRRRFADKIFYWPLAMGTLASVAVILLHNDRLPFFILPHFAIPVLFAMFVLVELGKPWMTGAAVFFGFCTTAVFIIEMQSQASNEEQILAQQTLVRYMEEKHFPLYYDGTGVLPLWNNIFAFPAPQHAGNETEVLGVLNQPGLSLVFFGNRLFYYMQSFYLGLEERYFIQIGPGVFAKSYAIRSTHELKNEEWQAACAQFKNPEKMYVYSGSNFLTMRQIRDKVFSCSAPPGKVETKEAFVAFSPFDPIVFNSNRSFSQIFDHRPYY